MVILTPLGNAGFVLSFGHIFNIGLTKIATLGCKALEGFQLARQVIKSLSFTAINGHIPYIIQSLMMGNFKNVNKQPTNRLEKSAAKFAVGIMVRTLVGS